MKGIRYSRIGSVRRFSLLTGGLVALSGGFGLFLLALALTGHLWRAIAYGTVVLFALLGLLALYFWGALLLGSLFERIANRRPTGAWDIGLETAFDVPQHDIDPGLELLAAGILAYRLGEVRPQAHFRRVPLDDVRAIRPFFVARTGAPRQYQFAFALNDQTDVTRFADAFTIDLHHVPQVVVPPYRLLLEQPDRLAAQHWIMQVRSGVTVVTSFRFMFDDGSSQAADAGLSAAAAAVESSPPAWQPSLLPKLIDEAVKRDVMISTQEIVLEVV